MRSSWMCAWVLLCYYFQPVSIQLQAVARDINEEGGWEEEGRGGVGRGDMMESLEWMEREEEHEVNEQMFSFKSSQLER